MKAKKSSSVTFYKTRIQVEVFKSNGSRYQMCILEKVLWARFAEVVKQYWVCTVTKPKVVLAVIVTILFIRLAVKNPDQTGSAYRSCEPW